MWLYTLQQNAESEKQKEILKTARKKKWFVKYNEITMRLTFNTLSEMVESRSSYSSTERTITY